MTSETDVPIYAALTVEGGTDPLDDGSRDAGRAERMAAEIAAVFAREQHDPGPGADSGDPVTE